MAGRRLSKALAIAALTGAAVGGLAFILLGVRTHGWALTTGGSLSLLLLGAVGSAQLGKLTAAQSSARVERLWLTLIEERAAFETERARVEALQAARERAQTQQNQVVDFRLSRLVKSYEEQLTASSQDYSRLLAEHRALGEQFEDLAQEYNILVQEELVARSSVFGQQPRRRSLAEAGQSVVWPAQWRRASREAGQPSATSTR
jgi:hypothetical protein